MAKLKKAQNGETLTGSRKGLGVFKTTKERTTSGGIARPYKYDRTSIDTTGYSKGKPTYKVKTESGESDKTGLTKVNKSTSTTVSRKQVPSVLESLKKKNGGMIKRADGSMSKRGLWDNLRSKAAQNKKTGAKPKAPTKAMLSQEKKIKSKGK
jgi:hypothetical protein